MTNSVTSKGQVTIPKPVRKALGINPGTKVRISAVGNHARIEVVKTRQPSRPEDGPAIFNYRGPKITLEAMTAAIGRRARNQYRADVAVGAGAVVDNDGLAEFVCHARREQARADVGATGWVRRDKTYRALRISLRQCPWHCADCSERAKGEMVRESSHGCTAHADDQPICRTTAASLSSVASVLPSSSEAMEKMTRSTPATLGTITVMNDDASIG